MHLVCSQTAELPGKNYPLWSPTLAHTGNTCWVTMNLQGRIYWSNPWYRFQQRILVPVSLLTALRQDVHMATPTALFTGVDRDSGPDSATWLREKTQYLPHLVTPPFSLLPGALVFLVFSQIPVFSFLQKLSSVSNPEAARISEHTTL